MNAPQFYSDLAALVSQNKIRNLEVKQEDDLVVINASYFNFNTINHLIGLLFAVFIATINSMTLVVGVLLSIVLVYNLFKDADAINKVEIDFTQKKFFLYTLRFFGKQEIQFAEISKFTTSNSGQVDLYNRTRLNCNVKTGERIILFDFAEDRCSSDFLHLFNTLLKAK